MAARPTIAYHTSATRSTSEELVRRWLRQGKVWLLPLLLSDYGRDIIEHKYDAFVTDRAYENRPSGRWGPIGKTVDWIVLRQDIHVGLRQRLAIVTDEVAAAVRERWADGATQVHLVSGPCGLARDLRQIWLALDRPEERLALLGLDLDASGDVLATAAQQARALDVPLRTARCDLLDHHALAVERPADIFLSIGLTVWLDDATRAHFLEGLRKQIVPGGLLFIDTFHAHLASHFARDFEMAVNYPSDEVFERALHESGFEIEGKRTTKNGVNTLYRCRA